MEEKIPVTAISFIHDRGIGCNGDAHVRGKQMDIFRHKGTAATLTEGKEEASASRAVRIHISNNVTRIWHNSLNNRSTHTNHWKSIEKHFLILKAI